MNIGVNTILRRLRLLLETVWREGTGAGRLVRAAKMARQEERYTVYYPGRYQCATWHCTTMLLEARAHYRNRNHTSAMGHHLC
jgi:hypothetical protein